MKLYSNKEVRKQVRSCNKTYVYCLHRPDGRVFYVGVGKKYRCLWHMQKSSESSDGNKLKQNIINKYGRLNMLFQIVKFGTEEECLSLEKKLISFFGKYECGGLLSNMSDGGDKGPTGISQSKESNIKRRQTCLLNVEVHRKAAKEKWESMSIEEREISLAKLQSGILSEKGKIKIDKARRDRWDKEYSHEKQSEKLSEFYRNNPEAVERSREAAKKRWEDPEYREMMARAKVLAKEKRLALKQANFNLENIA